MRIDKKGELGGVAIEFAILFPFLFIIFYAGVSFCLYLVLQSALEGFIFDALRDAIQIKTSFNPEASQMSLLVEHMDKHLKRSWLSDYNLSGCLKDGGWYSFDALNNALESCVKVDFPLPNIHLFGISIPGLGDEIKVERTVFL